MLCRRVCEECFRRRGLKMSCEEWTKYLRVYCHVATVRDEDWNGDDLGADIPVYEPPPIRCPFLAEHAVLAKETR